MTDHPLMPYCIAIASLTPDQLIDIIEGYVDSPDVCAMLDDMIAMSPSDGGNTDDDIGC
jgi:hypothetical protein